MASNQTICSACRNVRSAAPPVRITSTVGRPIIWAASGCACSFPEERNGRYARQCRMRRYCHRCHRSDLSASGTRPDLALLQTASRTAHGNPRPFASAAVAPPTQKVSDFREQCDLLFGVKPDPAECQKRIDRYDDTDGNTDASCTAEHTFHFAPPGNYRRIRLLPI